MVVLVTMGEVDRYQIHYTAYHRWMDQAYHRLVKAAGRSIASLLDAGAATPAVRSGCDFLRPVHLEDEVTIQSWIERPGRSSFAVRHLFTDQRRQPVAVGEVIHVYIESGCPAPLPDWLRSLAASAREGEVAS